MSHVPNLAKVNEMNPQNVTAMSFEIKEASSTNVPRVQASKSRRTSVYAALLQGPASMLASNVSDRADVSFAAILGYN